MLDAVERRFWGDIWDSVPAEVAAERGIERRDFGPVQATIVTALPQVGMLNLVLGATDPGAVDGGFLVEALGWVSSRGVDPYVPVKSAAAGAEAAERWLAANGYEHGRGWMKFTRDPHPPRFEISDAVEVVEVGAPAEEPFGAIAAAGFGMPAWGGSFFADLPGREDWRCYIAKVEGEAQACGAMRIHEGVAELGIGATLEPARRRGCQLSLLHRRIVDATAAGCHTLLVETGERVPGKPSASYRNILRAGFEEAYLRPNWVSAARRTAG